MSAERMMGCPSPVRPLAALASIRASLTCVVTQMTWAIAGGAPGARTQNQRIKSPLLYH